MADLLINHALANVWCEPVQDRQYIIKPARITPNGGAHRNVNVLWEYLALPDVEQPGEVVNFHVYQLGQIHQSLLNIQNDVGLWRQASAVSEQHGVVINVYVDNGTQLPLTHCFLRVNHDGNVVLAVRLIKGLNRYGQVVRYDLGGYNLDVDSLSVRFYSNAHYDSTLWQAEHGSVGAPVRTISQLISSRDDFDSFKEQCDVLKAHFGAVGQGTYLQDGFVVNDPGNGWNLDLIGKTLSFTWDASIKRQVNFPVSDLESFNSTLDGGHSKFLLMAGGNYDTIDYQDDIDFYLVKRSSPTAFKGIYIHRNEVDTVRMVTHNAYSIRTSYLQAYVDDLDLFNTLDELEIIANIRQGGLRRGLVQQHNRVEELYKMSAADILGAMIGVNATVPEWRAQSLEASAYTEIMRVEGSEITNTLVEDAYGYNATTKLMAKTHHMTEYANGSRFINAPAALCVVNPATGQGARSFFCYDANGKLITWFNNSGTYETIVLPDVGTPIAHVEAFGALYDAERDGAVFGANVEEKPLTHFGFRCYVCPKVAGVPTEVWTDITDTGEGVYFTFDPVGNLGNNFKPSITWDHVALNNAHLFQCVKIAKRVLFYKVPLNEDAYPGFVRFSVNAKMFWLTATVTRPQSLPPGVLDVFMDGECLVKDIDYYVQWPQIVVVRKPPRTPVEGLEVYVRCYDFCEPTTMAIYPARESGFIKGGMLSVDGQYDIRNDRNVRIVVAGALRDRSQVRFAEDDAGPAMVDGRPFSVTDVITRVEPYTERSTETWRAEAVDLDERVMDYLNVHVEENTPALPVIIGERWQVYSPFLSAIIHAFADGFLNAGELDTEYTNVDVDGWLAPYYYLLDYDPCIQNADTNYVVIHPHQYTTAMSVTLSQYRFLEYVITHYLSNKVDLTPSVIVGT